MKNTNTTTIITFAIILGLTGPAHAQGSTRHFSKAAGHSANAIAHASIGTGKLVSGAVAVPLMVSGEAGKASAELGTDLWNEANKGLPITDEVITVGPSPADAMTQPEQQ